MKTSDLKPGILAQAGTNYVIATWSHPFTEFQIIAGFRDLTPENGIRDFSMLTPPSGPWSKAVSGRTEIVVDEKEVFALTCQAAFQLLIDLNNRPMREIVTEWELRGGKSYLVPQP